MSLNEFENEDSYPFDQNDQLLDATRIQMVLGSLEKSLVLFEEGMNLIRECQGDLKKAEQRIEHLIHDSGKLEDAEESN